MAGEHEDEPPLKKRKVDIESKENECFYEGNLNEQNEYNGYGRLIETEPYQKYVGNFKNGSFNGFGILFFDIECKSLLIGNWSNNKLNGLSIMINEAQMLTFGPFIDGIQNGKFKEYEFMCFDFDFNHFVHHNIQRKYAQNPNVEMNEIFNLFFEKFSFRLIFDGMYQNDQRNGNGTLHFEDGGSLNGKWCDDELNDGMATYKYPNCKSTLKGKFKDTQLIKAKFFDDDGNEFPTIYSMDISTTESIAKQPLLRSEYESQRVRVSKSSLKDAGNGLFAKKDMKKGDVVCFYNGLRVDHETVNERNWSLNSNALTINDEFCVDIPGEYSLESAYCASLGHFANHHWQRQNCAYEPYYSPRFGEIKCLRAVKDIQKDEEIFVDYDYKDEFPEWYKQFASASKTKE